MEKEELKKILDQQLELLAEASKKEPYYEGKVQYAYAIAELIEIRLTYFKL